MKNSFKAYFICFIGALFYCFDYFVQVTPTVLAHSLTTRFNLVPSQLGVLGTCFFIPYCFMQLPAGLLLSRYGIKRCLCCAALLSAIALQMFSFSDSFMTTCIARGILGGCAAFSFISSVSLIYQWCSPRLFPVLTGAVQLSATIGSIIGLAPISRCVNTWGWKDTIELMSCFALGLSLLYLFFLQDKSSFSPTPSHTKKNVLATFSRYKNSLWAVYTIGFISWMPISGIGALWCVPYLIKARHISNVVACHFCSYIWIGLGCGSLLVGAVSEKLKSRIKPVVFCYLVGIIGSIALLRATTLSNATLISALLLIGVSASNQSLSFSFIRDTAHPDDFPTLSAFNNMAAILGGATAQFMMGCFIHAQQTLSISRDMVTTYQHAFLIIPFSEILGLSLTLIFITETYPKLRNQYPRIKVHESHN